MIIHKYGGKLEQASAFIDDLENQLAEAREQLENRSVDGSVYSAEPPSNSYTYGDSGGRGNDRRYKEMEAKITALQSELDRNEGEHSADQIMADLISYKMQFAMTAADLEEEKRKNKDGKTKLQAFAKRISALEHALADANEQTSIANEPKGMFSYFRGSAGSTAGSTAGSSHGGGTPVPIRHGPQGMQGRQGMGPNNGYAGGGGGAGGGPGGGGMRPTGANLQAVRR